MRSIGFGVPRARRSRRVTVLPYHLSEHIVAATGVVLPFVKIWIFHPRYFQPGFAPPKDPPPVHGRGRVNSADNATAQRGEVSGRHLRLPHEAAMATAVLTSRRAPRPQYEPLYDTCPRTGATLVFGDRPLAQSFGASGPGWFWWTCQPGCLPGELPTGPFATSYRAYRDAMT